MIIKRTKAILLVSLVLLNFLACKDKTEMENVNVTILGKWNWVSSTNAFITVTKTPQSTGKIKILEFLPNAVCREYENGKIISEMPYQIKKNNFVDTERYAFSLSLNSINWTNFSIEGKDKLIFNDAYLDGDLTIYEKVK